MKTKRISIDLQFFGGNPAESAEREASEEEFPEISVEADESDGCVGGASTSREAQTVTGAEAHARAHLATLERQAAEVRRSFPDFDLERELGEPLFVTMTALGVSVEDAYFAVHRKEIMEAAMREAAQKTAEKIAGAIRSGSRRPSESGGSSQAPFVNTFDYSKASKAQREAFKKDLRARMARGEKVYPTK